jgi:RND superfamily putative drug exporter
VVIGAVLTLGAVKPDTNIPQTAPGDTGKAGTLINARFGTAGKAAQTSSQEIVVFASAVRRVDDPIYQQTVENLMQHLRALRMTDTQVVGGSTVVSSDRIVQSTTTHYDTGAPRDRSPFVAPRQNGDVSLALVQLEGSPTELRDRIQPVIDTVSAAQRAAPDIAIALTGGVTTNKEQEDLITKDLSRSLTLNLPITFALLLVAFGTIVAGLVPIGLALVSIVTANAILAVISQVTPLNSIYSEMVLLMGLATGIDYALFVISRYRLERGAGKAKDAAIVAASATSGKAVAVAGITVLLSVSGMFLVGDPTFTSIAIAAIVVVALAVLASLTLLPALLGDGLNRLHVPLLYTERPREGGGVWGHISDAVVKHPLAIAVLTIALLLLLAAPVLGLNLGFNGAKGLPDAVAAKKASLLLQQNFTLGLTAPAVVVVDAGKDHNIFAPDVQAHISQFVNAVQAETASPANPTAFFGAPLQTTINDAGDTAQIQVPLNSDTGDKKAIAAIRHLRGDLVPRAFGGSGITALVTGYAAANVDFKTNIIARTPLVFGFVLGLAFLILLITFHSLVIPLKAILLNLLSVGATYGILALIFQRGWLLERPLSFQATGIIESWLPLFLFSILFGLSMDYHMFLLGRVKEAVEHGQGSRAAVATGIKQTAGTITNAAVIMVAVALTFAFAHDIGIKQFGFGLAVAILLDATIIRSILLPATMELLGERNWYLPRWLGWLPHIRMAE